MCGITGWIGHGEEMRAAGERGLEALATRGPDGRHLWIDQHARVALGNARLAILDPTPRASQPMTRGDARITHNGEIYNFVELREELEARGERFSTTSDTEVLLAAVRTWGDAAFPRLNGMWAFALWDPAHGMLLSRDRLGVKPLFVARGSACLHFASEIKALLGLPCLSWRPDLELVRRFIATGGTADAARATFFQGIERVPPASAIRIDPRGLRVTERTFWELEGDDDAGALGLAEAAVRFEETFRDAVRIRLRSDVPVGLALSGGIDSSAIAAVVATARPAVRAFSVRWSRSGDREGALIARVLDATGLDGAEVVAAPGAIPELLDRIVWHQDEPFAHSAPLGEWLVYQLASEHGCHVLLEGQGADELFGGYQALAFGSRFLDLGRRGAIRSLARELRAFRRRYPDAARRAAGYALVAAIPPSWRDEMSRIRWRTRSLGPIAPAPPPWRVPRQGSVLRQALAGAVLSTSLPALLRYADRSAMAHSVEVRSPFLDHRVVSLAFGLREELLVGDARTKRVVRESLRRAIPEVAEEPVKFGFTGPEARWIRSDLRPWLGVLAAGLDARGLARRGAASTLWRTVQEGGAPAQVGWRMAIAELWLRRYVDLGGRAP